MLLLVPVQLLLRSRALPRLRFQSPTPLSPAPAATLSTCTRRPFTFTMVSPAIKRNADHLTTPSSESKKPKGGSITAFFGVPKPKPSSANGTGSTPAAAGSSSRSSTFDKEKWVQSLTPEQKELLQLEIDTLHESWLAHLKDEVVTTEFLNLKRFLKKEKENKVKVFPPEEDVYSW